MKKSLSNFTKMSKTILRPTLIDTDPGMDDAVALLMAFKSPKISVVAVTVVAGNGPLTDMAANTMRCMATLPSDQQTIPVFKGIDRALLGKHREIVRSSHYHGADYLQDKPDLHPKRLSNHEVDKLCEEKHAVQAIIDLSKEYAGELELVFLGPLTNLAMAVRLDPGLVGRVKKLTIMGGNIFGVGNANAAGEYNFAIDPEAAHIVLSEFHTLGENLIIFSWEASRRCSVSPEMYKVDEFLSGSGKVFYDFYHHLVSSFRNDEMEKRILEGKESRNKLIYGMGKDNFFGCICDAFAMAVAIEPEIVTNSQLDACVMELDGHMTRGQMVVITSDCFLDANHRALKNALTPITIIHDIDPHKFIDMMKMAFTDEKNDK